MRFICFDRFGSLFAPKCYAWKKHTLATFLSRNLVMPISNIDKPKQQWDVDRYQQQHNFVWKFGASLLELIDLQPGYRVLDCGCGTGELTNAIHLAQKDISCIGMDASSSMIAKAKEQFPEVEFFVGDVSNFTIPGASQEVDVIFSNAALHWVPAQDAEKAVQSMSRVLKTRGQFVVEFGGKGNLQKIVKAVQNELKNYRTDDVDLANYYPSISEYSTLLERHGIEVLNAKLYDRPTALNDGKNGIKNWLKMFGSRFFTGLEDSVVESIMERVTEALKPELFDGNQFMADYRRIQIVGRKL